MTLNPLVWELIGKLWRKTTPKGVVAQDHTKGHRANRLPCAQVDEDTGPPKLATPKNADDPDINRGSIGQRNLHAAGNTSFRWGYSHR